VVNLDAWPSHTSFVTDQRRPISAGQNLPVLRLHHLGVRRPTPKAATCPCSLERVMERIGLNLYVQCALKVARKTAAIRAIDDDGSLP
jgi:hypothetical protein